MPPGPHRPIPYWILRLVVDDADVLLQLLVILLVVGKQVFGVPHLVFLKRHEVDILGIERVVIERSLNCVQVVGASRFFFEKFFLAE